MVVDLKEVTVKGSLLSKRIMWLCNMAIHLKEKCQSQSQSGGGWVITFHLCPGNIDACSYTVVKILKLPVPLTIQQMYKKTVFV